jgi:hypothetical protein
MVAPPTRRRVAVAGDAALAVDRDVVRTRIDVGRRRVRERPVAAFDAERPRAEVVVDGVRQHDARRPRRAVPLERLLAHPVEPVQVDDGRGTEPGERGFDA